MIFTVFDAMIIKMKINANPDDLASVLDASVGANGGKLELESSVKVGQAAHLYLNFFYLYLYLYLCEAAPLYCATITTYPGEIQRPTTNILAVRADEHVNIETICLFSSSTGKQNVRAAAFGGGIWGRIVLLLLLLPH